MAIFYQSRRLFAKGKFGIWKAYEKLQPFLAGAFLLGICINYPIGLFYSYFLYIWPLAEYFLAVFRCLVECVETCIVGSFLHILKCCCYNIAFDVLLNQLAIAYRTVFSVYFLSSGSENYIIAFSVCGFCIGYSYCSAFCFYACDYWLCRCDCRYREWIDVGPFAEYFLTFCITCPSVAVCIIGSLLYVVEVTCCLNLVLCNIYAACAFSSGSILIVIFPLAIIALLSSSFL